ncbi:MAG: hypothetical protein WC867_02085 [Candidatus Pacearchaeota archaeon]|jgi:hypothetical protein
MKKQILVIYLIFFINLFLINIVSSQEIVGEIGVSVIVTPASIVCSTDFTSWINPSTGAVLGLTSDNCYRTIDLMPSRCCVGSGICQPAGIGTDSNGDEIHHCVETTKKQCSDFDGLGALACNQDANTNSLIPPLNLPINRYTQMIIEVPPFECGTSYVEGNCLFQRSCNCTWESSTSKCLAVKTTTRTCPPVLTDKLQVNCKVEVTSYVDDCAGDGFIHITFNKFLDPPDPAINPSDYNCLPTDTKDISCEQVARMNFFGMFNIISVLALLIIFYVYQIGKDKKK